jgi:hypothetical protein
MTMQSKSKISNILHRFKLSRNTGSIRNGEPETLAAVGKMQNPEHEL